MGRPPYAKSIWDEMPGEMYTSTATSSTSIDSDEMDPIDVMIAAGLITEILDE